MLGATTGRAIQSPISSGSVCALTSARLKSSIEGYIVRVLMTLPLSCVTNSVFGGTVNPFAAILSLRSVLAREITFEHFVFCEP